MSKTVELKDLLIDKSELNWEAIGKDIRGLRKIAGLTQQELSRKAGVSRSFISGIENAKQVPSISTLRELLSVIWKKIPSKELEDYRCKSKFIRKELAGIEGYLREKRRLERALRDANKAIEEASKDTGIPTELLLKKLKDMKIGPGLAFLSGLSRRVKLHANKKKIQGSKRLYLMGYILKKIWRVSNREPLTCRELWPYVHYKPELKNMNQLTSLLKEMDKLEIVEFVERGEKSDQVTFN